MRAFVRVLAFFGEKLYVFEAKSLGKLPADDGNWDNMRISNYVNATELNNFFRCFQITHCTQFLSSACGILIPKILHVSHIYALTNSYVQGHENMFTRTKPRNFEKLPHHLRNKSTLVKLYSITKNIFTVFSSSSSLPCTRINIAENSTSYNFYSKTILRVAICWAWYRKFLNLRSGKVIK